MPFFFYLSCLICHRVIKAPSILLHFVAFLIYHALLHFSMQRQKSLALFTYFPEFFLQFAYQFLPAGLFSSTLPRLHGCRAFPAFALLFLCTENAFEEKRKKQLTKAFPHDKISKSSGEGRKSEYGRVPEWPMGTDCKSAAFSFGGNPPAPTKQEKSEPISDWRRVRIFRFLRVQQ